MSVLNEYRKYIDVSEKRAGVKITVTGTDKDRKTKKFDVLCDVFMVHDLSVPTGAVFSELFKERYPDFKYDFINIKHTYNS